jgi:hypothetical protein
MDYTQAQLRLHGWTLPLIKRLLGEPDKRAENPYYPNGPQMCLYDAARVEAAEQTDDFKENHIPPRGSALRRRVTQHVGKPPTYRFPRRKG